MNRLDFIKALFATTAMATLKPLESLSGNLPEDGNLMPVLFIGHGSPMNGIEDNSFSGQWQKLGKEIPTPKAVLCISAHWLTKGTHITAMNNPKTIHDFGGFPQALFEVNYPAPGDPELAKTTKQLIEHTDVGLDHEWGLDHGTWTVVKHMYPKANIPVLQLSIDYHKPGGFHYNLGRDLAELRKKGVLIIGSGNMVHNLRMMDFKRLDDSAYGYDWALEMNTRFKELIQKGDHKSLIDYQKFGEAGKLAIPTPDHYFPLLYTLALQQKGEGTAFFNDKAVAGSVTMTSVKVG